MAARQRTIPLGVARYSQGFTAPYASSDAESMSHAHTTEHSKPTGDGDNALGSVYSYNSTRDASSLVREIHGRIFNTLSDTYLLPTDEAEWTRLDKQHSLLLTAFNGLTPCPSLVDAVLAPGDEPKRILDVGCGTGLWAIEMAIKYPHCEVQGVDLAPTPIDVSMFPPNFQFEIDNVNHGMPHFYDQFDLVHARCIMVGITDAEKTMRELQLCLKPGGLLILVNGDKNIYNEQKSKVKMAKIEGDEDVDSVSQEGSWFQRKLWEAHEASKKAESNHEHASEMIDLGLWSHDLCDPETAFGGGLYVPLGPWASSSNVVEDQALKYVGVLMRQVALSVHRGYEAMIKRFGVTQETLDAWTDLVDEELNEMRIRMWCRYRFCWARRRAGHGLPAPQLPSPTVNTDLESFTSSIPESTNMSLNMLRPSYSAVELYHNQEEARAAWRKKSSEIGIWPTSLVARASLLQQSE